MRSNFRAAIVKFFIIFLMVMVSFSDLPFYALKSVIDSYVMARNIVDKAWHQSQNGNVVDNFQSSFENKNIKNLYKLAGDLKIDDASAAANYVGGTTCSGTASVYSCDLTSLTGGIGSAPQVGDVVVVVTGWASASNGNPGVSTSGYTEEYDLYANDTRDANISINWKVMDQTPDSVVSVFGTNNSGYGGSTVVQVWRGINTINPLDVVSPVGSLTTNNARPNSPSVTPITSGAIVITAGLGTGDTTPQSFSPPSGYSNSVVRLGLGTNRSSIAVIAAQVWEGGAEDPPAWTGGESTGNDSSAAGTLVLRPASESSAVGYVGGATCSGTAATYSCDLTSLTGGSGSAPQVGDVVVVVTGWASANNGNPGVSTSGYTETYDLFANDTRDANVSINWKVMGAVPDSMVNVFGTNNSNYGGSTAVQVWRGIDTANPIDVSPPAGSALTNNARPNSPGITPVTSGAIVITAGLGTGDTTPLSFAKPSGYFNPMVALGTGFNRSSIAVIAAKEWTGGYEDPPAWSGGESTTSDSAGAGTLVLRPRASLAISATAGNQVVSLSSGSTAQNINNTTCTGESSCSAIKLTAGGGGVTVTSIRITETGTVAANADLSNAVLLYDTDSNYSNGTAGTFGSVASFASDQTINFTNAGLTIPGGSSYYFYLRFDLKSGTPTYPASGQTIGISVANSTDIGTAGNPIVSGTATLSGVTAVNPQITSYANASESGLNWTSGCTGCGARIGPDATGQAQTITISGYGFGTDPGSGNRDSVSNNISIGTKVLTDNPGLSNITSWSNTTITIKTDTAVDSDVSWGTQFGGASALRVTAGGQTVSTGTNFFVLPQILSTINNVGYSGDGAREYSSADTDGVITLNGTRFGTSATGGYVRIFGCDSVTCTSPSGSATINSWTNTAITLRVPAVIDDNTYTGSISMRQGSGSNNLLNTYPYPFRILPRISGINPDSGPVSTTVTISGDHLCQNSGVCPSFFDSSNAVGFFDQVPATVFSGWAYDSIVTAVPLGSSAGNVAVTSSDYLSNPLNFTVINQTFIDTGTDPAPATVAPGSGIVDVDYFTLETDQGNDDISSVTVNLSDNTGVGRLSITNDRDDELGYVNSPVIGLNTISVSGMSAIPRPQLRLFKIKITPLSHAAMPVPPGALYAITANVASFVGEANTHVGSDTCPNALTIDNQSPNGATAVSGSGGSRAVTLNWTSSNSSDFSTSTILRWAASSAGSEVPVEGVVYSPGASVGTATVACSVSSSPSATMTRTDGLGGSSGCTTAPLTGGQDYTYKIFQQDVNGNYNVGILAGTFTPPAGSPPIITNVATTTVNIDSAEITWLTADQQSTSQVQYNLTGVFESDCSVNNDCTVLDTNLSFSHDVWLSNLSANTVYYFRVRSQSSGGFESISSSPNFWFLTPSSSGAFPPSGGLSSITFDTMDSSFAAYNSIMWKGRANGGAVQFQFAASNSPDGPWEDSDFVGGDSCSSIEWYAPSGPDVPVELKCFSRLNNKRYFKYKMRLCSNTACSTGGDTTPVVEEVIVNWSP